MFDRIKILNCSRIESTCEECGELIVCDSMEEYLKQKNDHECKVL